MKKALIALGLVALMSMSCFALSLELLNVVGSSNTGWTSSLNAGAGLGFGVDIPMVGNVDMIAGLAIDNVTDGQSAILKAYYPVWGSLRAGLAIGMVQGTAPEYNITLGVKKTLVSGVDMLLDAIVYAADNSADSSLGNVGATVGLSVAL